MSSKSKKRKLKLSLSRRQLRRFKIFSKHPVSTPIYTFIGLVIITVITLILAAQSNQFKVDPNSRIVIVSHDGVKQVVPTHDKTVGQLLANLNIKVKNGDVVEPSVSTVIDQEDFRINIYRAKPVEVIDGNNKTYTFSAATTARAIADQAGTKVYPEDNVQTVPNQNFITDPSIGTTVVINRAIPVYLNLYGSQLSLRTHTQTVNELLKHENIKLASSDEVVPAASTQLKPNSQVFIIRHGTKIESITQTIDMPIQVIQDDSLAYGTSAIRQTGSNGTQVITYQEQLNNGQIVQKTQIQSVITVPAVTEVVVEGTSLSGIKADMALAGISSGDYQYADYIISHESGWCPTKAQGEHQCPAIPDNQFTSNGYGLCQATPGSKMVSAGSDWATNPITQLKWCNGYAVSRYGGWSVAYNHWINNGNW